jgi:hypothetical protein
MMARNYQARQCTRCGERFIPTGSRSTWCSNCYVVECTNCGKPFRATKTRIEHGTAKFCSRSCKHEGEVKPTFTHSCPQCKRAFESNSPNSRYCIACRTVKCPVCGKFFHVQSKYVGKAKYCSRECQTRASRSHDWTSEDEEFVRRNYPYSMSLKDLAHKFNVSVSAVARLTTCLGLECPVELRNQRSGTSRRFWTKQRILEEIKRIAKSEPISSAHVQVLNGSLHNSACKLFGSWKETVEAAGFDYDEVNLYANRKTWATQDVLREIRELHVRGEDLKASVVRDRHSDVFNAARRDPRLGTWEAAIEAAGISYDDIKGDAWGSSYLGKDGHMYPSEIEGKVGDRLFKLKSKNLIGEYRNQVRVTEGRAWTCDFVIDLVDGERLWLEVDGLGEARADGTYVEGHEKIDHFEKSGLEYAIVRTPKQAEKVIHDSKKRKRNLALEHDAPRNLVELGGNRYTDNELLDELARVCRELGRPPTRKEMDELGNITASTVKRRLGWAEACASAGFPVREKSELILDDIRQVIESLGRVPSQSEYLRLGRYGAVAISSHLGGYDQAVMLAGYEPLPRPASWCREKVIMTIQELNRQGCVLSAKTLIDSGHATLYHAGRRYFNTWENAMEAANVPMPNTRKLKTWARDYDACQDCGQTRYRHAGKGLCSSCYSKKRHQR